MAIPLNDNIKINAPKPSDPRFFAPDNTPWASIVAVEAGIPLTERHPELTVDVMGVEYWWKDGAWELRESNLVHKTGNETIDGEKTFTNSISALLYKIGSKQMLSDYSWGGDDSNVWIGGAVNNTVTGVASGEGNNLVAIGLNALQSNTTGGDNIAIGKGALKNNTTGDFNSAFGQRVLENNTTGDYNTGIGVNALFSNTAGNNNNAFGQSCLENNTAGNNNNAFGKFNLFSNTTGNDNNALGQRALQSNTTGYNNNAIGQSVLIGNTTGNFNNAIGQFTLFSNTIGSNNNAIGESALFGNTTGSNNSAIGKLAGANIAGGSSPNTNPINSIFIGESTRASTANDTNQIVIGHSSTGLGSDSTIIGNDSTTKTAIKGRLLLGTTSDNGVDMLQVSGTVTATNLSGTNKGDQSENNVYLSHEFLALNGNDFVGLSNVNSGTIGQSTANLTVNNPGIARITSSTSANSGGAIRSFSNVYILKGGEVFTEIFNPLVFTNTVSRIGLHNSTSSSDANSGVYFEISTSGDLTLKTANNGTPTTSATIATLSVSTWYKVRFTVNAGATSVLGELFNASGVLIASATNTTNIPTTARQLNVCSITTNSGTTATALIDVDFMSLKTTLTR